MFKHTSFIREERLLFRTQGPEVAESLKNPGTFSVDQWSQFIENAGNAGSTPEYWNKALENLDSKIRATITGNIVELARRGPAGVAKKNLDALMTSLNVQPTNTDTQNVTKVEATNDAPKTFGESVKKTINDIGEDFMQGSPYTKAGYIAGGVVGFLALRWLWRKAFGTEGKEGWLKKAAKWSLSLGAAGLGLLGVHKIQRWWNGKNETEEPGDKSSNTSSVLTAPAGIALGMANEMRDTGKKAINLIGEHTTYFYDLFKNDPEKAYDQLAARGLMLVLKDGKFVVVDVMGRAVTRPFEVVGKTAEWVATGKMPSDYFMVWGGTGAAYMISVQTARLINGRWDKLIPKGIFLTPVRSLVKSAAWPAYMGKHLLQSQIWKKDGMKAIKLSLMRNTIVGKAYHWKEISGWLKAVNANNVDQQMQRWIHLQEELRVMKEYGPNSFGNYFSKEQIASVENVVNGMSDSLHKYGKTLTREMVNEAKSPIVEMLYKNAGHTKPEEFRVDMSKSFAEHEFKMKEEAAAERARQATNNAAEPEAPRNAASTSEAASTDARPVDTEEARSAGTTADSEPKMRKAAGDGVVDSGPVPATHAEEVRNPAAPETSFRVVRQDGTVVDAQGNPVSSSGDTASANRASTRVREDYNSRAFQQEWAPNGTAAGAVSGAALEAAQESRQATNFNRQINMLMADEQVVNLLKNANLSADEMQNFLRAIDDVNPDTLIKIRESTKAKALLVGAMKAGSTADKATEVARILRTADRARNVRIVWNAAGFAFDGFGAVLCAWDYMENESKIAHTKNPELRAFYETARPIIIADGLISMGGMIYGSAVAYSAWASGASVATALGASAGWVMLPIGLAVMGARVLHGQLQASVEYHSASEQELMRATPGELLAGVAKTSDGSVLNFGQIYAGWFPDGKDYDPHAANRSARETHYMAYFGQSALTLVPQVSILDVLHKEEYADLASQKTEEIKRRLRNIQNELYRKFVNNATGYIKERTNGKFEIVNAEELRGAEQFALQRYMEYWNVISTDSQSEVSEWKSRTQNKLNEEKNAMYEALIEASSAQTSFVDTGIPIIMHTLRNELAEFERKVISTNYSNWSQEWDSWGGEEGMRNSARGYAVELIYEKLESFSNTIAPSRKVTQDDIDALIADIRLVINREKEQVDTLAIEASQKDGSGYYRSVGAQKGLTTPNAIVEYVREYPFSPIEKVSAKDAISITGIEYHASYYTKHPLIATENDVVLTHGEQFFCAFKGSDGQWKTERAFQPGSRFAFAPPNEVGFWRSKPSKGEMPKFVLRVEKEKS